MDAGLAAIAGNQAGVFSRSQALQYGETHHTLRAQCRRGALVALHRSTFAVAGTPNSMERRLWACQLEVGGPMAFSGLAAAYVLGLAGLPEPGLIDMLVPRSRRPRRLSGARCIVTVDHELLGARVVAGHPVASLPVMLRRLAADLPRSVFLEVVQDQLRLRTTTTAQLRAGLGRGGRGSSLLRSVLAEVSDGSQSGWERALAGHLRRSGVRRPQRQKHLLGLGGDSYWLDFYWPAARLGVEVDGYASHGSVAAFGYDRRRRNRVLVEHGIHLLHYTPAQVRDRADVVVAEIVTALRQRGVSTAS